MGEIWPGGPQRAGQLPPRESGSPGSSLAWSVCIKALPPIKLVQEENQRKAGIFAPHVGFGLRPRRDHSAFVMFTF